MAETKREDDEPQVHGGSANNTPVSAPISLRSPGLAALAALRGVSTTSMESTSISYDGEGNSVHAGSAAGMSTNSLFSFELEGKEEAPQEVPESLLNFWYPVCYSTELDKSEVFAIELWGEPLVVFRNKEGKPVCIQDACPHRATPLSLGFVKEGELYCRYHGWRFGGDRGQCTVVPSLPGGRVPKRLQNQGHPAKEEQGFIWVYPGDENFLKDSRLPTSMVEEDAHDPRLPVIQQVWDSDYSYIQVMENLLDPCHLQFTHEGFQQKNVGPMDKIMPVKAFEFKTWDWRTDPSLPKWTMCAHILTDETKKPIDLKLICEAPVLQRAEVRNPSGYHLTINHYIVPVRPGKTRIFLKLARNFVTWLPNQIFAKSNDDIMQQDVTVLTGQMMRIRQKAHRWNFPVPADAGSMAYRKFWDAAVIKSGKLWFKEFTRSNVCKSEYEKGCLRGVASEIEDLPAFVHPHSGIRDHQAGLEELWASQGTWKWQRSRPKERSIRAVRNFGYTAYWEFWPSEFAFKLFKALLVVLFINCVLASFVFWQQYFEQPAGTVVVNTPVSAASTATAQEL